MYNKDEVWRLVCFTIISQLGVYGHSLHSTPRGPPGTRDLHYSVTFITLHYIHTTYRLQGANVQRVTRSDLAAMCGAGAGT